MVCDYAEGQPALVFVNSRKQTETVALHILQNAGQRFVLSRQHRVSGPPTPLARVPLRVERCNGGETKPY